MSTSRKRERGETLQLFRGEGSNTRKNTGVLKERPLLQKGLGAANVKAKGTKKYTIAEQR